MRNGNKRKFVIIAVGLFTLLFVILMIMILGKVIINKRDAASDVNAKKPFSYEPASPILPEETLAPTPEEATPTPTQSPEEAVAPDAATPTPAPTAKPAPEASLSPSPAAAQNTPAPAEISPSGMSFTEINETVTAKEGVRLRDIPSQGGDSNIIHTLQNGETAVRTGINSDTGWSKLEYNGQVCYAVSSYLTTDLNYSTPAPTEDSGLKTTFAPMDDYITAKSVTNLRTLPSVTNEASQVVVALNSGEVVHRTGINTELGWSRVEYNGQTLYCISSYMKAAE